MEYKALISFCGLVSMAEGEVREISDSTIAKDLEDAGFVEKVKKETKKPTKKVSK
jgi:hypothetical protein